MKTASYVTDPLAYGEGLGASVLPEGWVTGVDISRVQQLRALGNGVVPQQAAHAITTMLAWQNPAQEAPK